MDKRIKLREITTVSLCIAFLCASSYFVIPMPFTPIVFSIHTIAVNLVALLFSPKLSFVAMLTYLVMGLVGLPVFSGGTGGVDKLFGPTGGFYFGFVISALVLSLLKGKEPSFKRYVLLTTLVAIPLQHMCAIVFMCFHNGFHIAAAFVSVSLPFIVPDLFKAVISSVLAVKLNKIIKANQ